MSNKGMFIVLEGIDGAGGETQANLLTDRLGASNRTVRKLSYPDYTGPIAPIIQEYLQGKHDFSKEVQLLLYAADYLKDQEKIAQWKDAGNIIVADRYFTSALAYQCTDGVPVEKGLAIGKSLAFVIPDTVLYLEISVETSIARKTKEKQGNLDRHESDQQFLSAVAATYRHLAQNNIFAPWKIVNGEQPIEKVTQDILRSIT